MASRRAVGAIAVAAALFAAMAGPAVAVVPPATGSTTVVTVRTGGDRDTDTSVAPLAGVRLALYDSAEATDPVAQPWALCVADTDGDCNFVVPATDGANEGRRFFVRQLPDGVPDGWFTNPVLRTGSGSGSNSVERTYQFQTPPMVAGRTYSSTDSSIDFMYSHTYSDGAASDGVWQQSRDNPPLDADCGLDVALVLDLSASVGSNLPTLKQAANGFADALVGTPSRLAVFSFSGTSPSTGTVNHPELTSVSTQAGADEFKSIYADWELGAGTNWDQGVYAVAKASERYELVMVLTDGNPTRFGTRPSGDGSNTHFVDVENGIFSANAVKAKDSRLVALGMGSGVQGPTGLNLRALSGPVAFDSADPNPLEADYYQTTTFAAAAQALRELAISQCSGTVSVVKLLVPAGNTGEDVTGSTVAGAGWQFSATSDDATVIDSPQTTTDDGTGSVSFDLTFPGGSTSAAVTVDETQQPGHTLITQGGENAVCRDLSDGSPVPVTNSGATGFTVEASADAPVSCQVHNRPGLPATVTVDKEWIIDGEVYAEGTQPPGFTADLTLTGPGGAPATPQPWAEPRPGYVQGDTTTIDESLTLTDPACTAGEPLLDGTEPLPHTTTLTSPTNHHTITNTVTCHAHLTLVKKVRGDADPTAWTLSADGPTPITGATGDESVTGAPVDPGTYLLSETGPAGYTAADWTCTSTEGEVPVEAAQVTLTRGADITCTIVNTAESPGPGPGPEPGPGPVGGEGGQPGGLATTGATVSTAVGVAAALLLTGLAIVLTTRRRQRG